MALNRQGVNRALHVWRTYVGSNYQAKVDAANSARTARLIGLDKGPFNIAANTFLPLIVQGTQTNVALTAGAARTTAQVATDVNDAAIGATASADAQTRLQLDNDTAPVTNTPSTLKVGVPSSGVNAAAALGFGIGEEDMREAMQNPGPNGFIISDQAESELPMIWVRRVTVAPRGVSREDKDTFTLEVVVRDNSPSNSKKAAAELCQHHIDAIDEILHDDPSAEGCFVYSEVERILHTPHVIVIPIKDRMNEIKKYVLAEAVLQVKIEVIDWRN